MSFHLNNSNSFFRSPCYLFQESDPNSNTGRKCHSVSSHRTLCLSHKQFTVPLWRKGPCLLKNLTEIKCTYHKNHHFQVYNLWVSDYSQGCAPITTNSRTFHHPRKKCWTHQQSLPISSSRLLATTTLLSAYGFAYSRTFHTNGIVQYVTLVSFPLSIMFSRYLHVLACISTSILF